MTFIHDAQTFQFPQLKQVNLPTGRVYKVESGEYAGAVYPSITRVLGHKEKPGLIAWKERVGPEEAARVSARATIQGQNVHKLMECYLNNEGLPSYMPHVAELWGYLRPWLDKHVNVVYAQESDVFSDKLGVAGRLDLLALIDDILTIGDAKTSSRFKIEEYVHDYYLQGTFYAVAIYERVGVLPKRIILPIVSPQGIQVFESTPMKHFEELVSRVDEFYQSYAIETLDNAAPAAV